MALQLNKEDVKVIKKALTGHQSTLSDWVAEGERIRDSIMRQKGETDEDVEDKRNFQQKFIDRYTNESKDIQLVLDKLKNV